MASNIVVDEMFPEGSGSFMDVDEGHIGSVGGKEVRIIIIDSFILNKDWSSTKLLSCFEHHLDEIKE